MRTYGTLSRWNESRGFGFVVPVDGKQEVFVHISAFPRDGKRPLPGEMISFDLQQGADGRARAVNVTRPGSALPAARGAASTTASNKPWLALLAALAIGAIAVYGYRNIHSLSAGAVATTTLSPESLPTQQSQAPGKAFACDGRTQCSQMTSCAEANYFLKNCPNTAMDGNGDGEPCEQQWCN